MMDDKNDLSISMPPQGSNPPSNEDTTQPETTAKSTEPKCSFGCVCVYILAMILFVIVVPLFLIYALVAFLVCNKDVTDKEETDVPPKEKQIIYKKVKEFQGTAFHMARAVSIIHTRFMILLLTWLVINLCVKSLRSKRVFSSYLWQWTLLVVIVSCGYPVISMATRLLLHSLIPIYQNRKDTVYYMKGLRRSMNLIILNGSLFLAWHFYFHSEHGLRYTNQVNFLFKVAPWTLLSLFVFSVCWLLKTFLLLQWESHCVYNRFKARILRVGFQLYFLALISGMYWDIFTPKRNGGREKNGKEDKASKKEEKTMLNEEPQIKKEKMVHVAEGMEKEERQDKTFAKDIKDRMLPKDAKTTYHVMRMAKRLITLANLSSREDEGEDGDIRDLLEECKNKFKGHECINEKVLSKVFGVDEQEAKLLYEELEATHPSGRVSYETFKKWAVRAHKNCLALGYTLIDAEEVVSCLNMIMTLAVIAVVVSVWLLLMKVATITLILLVISPFVATTYIFSDTCKTFFEGVLFAFVKHPFDVGDRCLVDETEMEVKRINILTTTFMRIVSAEEVIFPNSVLATKIITNLKGQPDPSDHIELNLDPTTENSQIRQLAEKIDEFINKDRHPLDAKENCSIVIAEIGNVMKATIRFKHFMDIDDATHSQCQEKKMKQRSELLLGMRRFLKDLNIKTVEV